MPTPFINQIRKHKYGFAAKHIKDKGGSVATVRKRKRYNFGQENYGKRDISVRRIL